MRVRFLVLAVVALQLGADAPADAVKKEKDLLQGTWQAVAITEPDGRELNAEQSKALVIIFAADKLTIKEGKRVVEADYQVDPTKKPKESSYTDPQKKRTVVAIYELDGDMLKVCLCLRGTSKPKEFKADKETGLAVVVLKREKK